MCVKCELNDPGTIKELNDPGLIFIVIQVKESQGYIHRRTGRGAGGGGFPTLPEFSGDFQNFSKFWGASPPDPLFDTLLGIFVKNSKSLHACEKFTCAKSRSIRAI